MRVFGDPFSNRFGKTMGRSNAIPFRYLLDDEFITNAAAPLTSPRNAEPGPGQLGILDTTNLLSIVSGECLASNQSIAGNDPALYTSSSYARAAGLVFKARTKQITSGAGALGPFLGTTTAQNSNSTPQKSGILFGSGIMSLFSLGQTPSLLDTYVADTYYVVCMILRAAGFLITLDSKLIAIDTLDTTATVWGQWATGGVGRRPDAIDYFRIAQLSGLFANEYSIATQRLAGARAANDTFVHEAGAQWVEFTVTLPSANFVIVRFRRQDDNNCWLLRVGSTGTFELIEVVGGVSNTRCTIASCATGDRLQCVMDGNSVRLIRLRAGACSQSAIYASVSTFTTLTDGIIGSLGTGGGVSDLVTWPRNLSGSALAEINRI